MRRFWLDSNQLQKKQFLIEGPSYHHICRVSKIQKGEPFEIFVEGLKKYKVALTFIDNQKAIAKILSQENCIALEKPYIHLALSIPRFTTLDSIIPKAVELGVKEIHPFVSEKSFISKTSSFIESKKQRIQKIIEKAMAVSGRSEALIFHDPCMFFELKFSKTQLALMAHSQTRTESLNLKSVLKDQTSPEEIYLFVGSEAGFTEKEVSFFQNQGGHLFSLGPQILKVETACLSSLSILKYHFHMKTES